MKPYYLGLLLIISFIKVKAQPSPYGNGLITNQALDTLLVDTSYLSHAGSTFALNTYLKDYDYNLYIPQSYDGTKPFALITFINAGNAGTIWPAWFPVLEQKNIIVIAGNNIGNAVNVPIRMGVALAGAHALSKELNIDPNRIYTSGNSGGGRTASVLMYLFPELFKGMIPNCGSAYLRQVDQDYETHQPNSHYEYIFPFSQSELEYVHSFNPKMAFLTAYDDFREGDLMNIYHNGSEPDGFSSKLLEIPGNHCATSEQHFRDGMNFLEHPRIEWISDSFNLGGAMAGNGYLANALENPDSGLVLSDTLSTLRFRDPIRWNDGQGGIFRFQFRFNTTANSINQSFNIGLFDLQDGYFWDSVPSQTGDDAQAFILLRFLADSLQPRVVLLLNNRSKGIQKDTLFEGRFADWDPQALQRLKIHAWNNELRIEFSAHLDPNSQGSGNLKVLDDLRSLQVKNQSLWDSLSFGDCLLVASAKRSAALANKAPIIRNVQVLVADTNVSGVLNSKSPMEIAPNELVLFPNPSSDFVSIKTPNMEPLPLKLMDLQGRVLIRHLHSYGQSQINTANLPNGMYFLKAPNGRLLGKLLVRH